MFKDGIEAIHRSGITRTFQKYILQPISAMKYWNVPMTEPCTYLINPFDEIELQINIETFLKKINSQI